MSTVRMRHPKYTDGPEVTALCVIVILIMWARYLLS
jgi:hypothetical protein